MTSPNARVRNDTTSNPLSALALLLVALALVHTPAAAQQDYDPITEPKRRPDAEMPLNVGIVTGLTEPISIPYLEQSTIKKPERYRNTRFEVGAYIDTWQAGFAHKDYGDMFSFGTRTVGRDIASGLYLELGSKSFEDTVTSWSISSWGIGGYGSTTSINNRVAMMYAYDWEVAFLSYAGSDSTTEDDEDSFYFGTRISLGPRLPLGPVALHLLGQLSLSIFNSDYIFSGVNFSNDIEVVASFSLTARLFFNTQLN